MVIHFCLDFFRISHRQMKFDAINNITVVHKYTITFAIVQVVPTIYFVYFPINRYGINLFYHISHFAAITIGIHKSGPAKCTGNPHRPFKPGKAVLLCKSCYGSRSYSSISSNPSFKAGHFRFYTGSTNRYPANSFITNQAIGTAANQCHRQTFCSCFS